MAKKTSQADQALNLAGVLAKRVQIRDVRLVDSAIRLGWRDDRDPPEQIGLRSWIKVSHVFAEEAKSVCVVIMLMLRGMPTSEEGSDKPEDDEQHDDLSAFGDEIFRIQSSFEVRYSIADISDLEAKHFDAFSRMNGVYNLWPYWREYVQSTLPRMGLPPLTLPVMTQAKIEMLTRSAPKEEAADSSSDHHSSQN